MEQRLIDANAYAAEMKTRQDACKETMDAAKEDDNWELYAHMSAKFSIFAEAKLTLDAMPTVDAVPVDFLKKFAEGKRGYYSDFVIDAVKAYKVGANDEAGGERGTDEQ